MDNTIASLTENHLNTVDLSSNHIRRDSIGKFLKSGKQ